MNSANPQEKLRFVRYHECSWQDYAANPLHQDAFSHRLAPMHNRRAESKLTADERNIRAEILADGAQNKLLALATYLP